MSSRGRAGRSSTPDPGEPQESRLSVVGPRVVGVPGHHRQKAKESAMTTLSDRPHTALVVIDVQKGVVADAHERDAVIANIGTLVDRARSQGVAVVWVQHSDAH